jgi:serine/threonine-protein kinase
VSPQNILVSTGGRSKLIDFGVAKARDRLAGDTSQAVLKGKIRYAAIEQLLGNPVDRRADVWSMGAVLHTMLARSSPFPGESDVAILRGVLAGAEPLPVPEWVPKPVARIIDKCLQRDPAARFQSALELQQALESAMMECGLPCTSTEVGAFATELTRERIASRKTTLQLARRAVAERQRVRELLERPSVADPSGSDVSAIPKPEVGPTDTRVGPSSLRPANVRRAPTASPDDIEVELGEPATRIVNPATSALSKPLDNLETERLANGTSEVTSTQASISIVGERASTMTSRRSLVALGGLIVAVLAAILAVLVVRGPGPATGSSSAGPGSVATADTATTIAPTTAVVPPSATSTASATPPAAGSIAAALPSASPSADVPPAAHATRTLTKTGAPVAGKPGNPGSRPTATANKTGGELGGTIDSRK